MTRLSAAARRRLPARDFGLPETRQYPDEDRRHAALAKGRAKQELDAGRLSRAQYREIVMSANRREHRNPSSPVGDLLTIAIFGGLGFVGWKFFGGQIPKQTLYQKHDDGQCWHDTLYYDGHWSYQGPVAAGLCGG